MLEFIGSHFDILAVAACAIFMVVLGAASLGDALRRSRERRAREAGIALASAPRRHPAESVGQDERAVAEASQAA